MGNLITMNEPQTIGQNLSFHPERFQRLFEAEGRHFWFRARNRCIAAAIGLIPDPASVQDIIEHGCGTGYVLQELRRLFPYARMTGADLFAEGLSFARQRFDGSLVQLDVMQPGYREAFDLICIFDVLEHLDDDLQALQVLREQLRPGRWLLLTVPAHMSLWGNHDVAAGHRRRYTRGKLLSRLSEAGFEVKFCTEFMLALLPLMLVRRRLAWRGTGSKSQEKTNSEELAAELKVYPLLSRLLEFVLRPEAWWIGRGRRLPAGTSIIALAYRGGR